MQHPDFEDSVLRAFEGIDHGLEWLEEAQKLARGKLLRAVLRDSIHEMSKLRDQLKDDLRGDIP